jgi:hypothetical protein
MRRQPSEPQSQEVESEAHAEPSEMEKGQQMKNVFTMIAVLVLSACGDDANVVCHDRKIQSIRDCFGNWQLRCNACVVSWDDGSEELKCQPVLGAVERVCEIGK